VSRLQAIAQRRLVLQFESERERGAARHQMPSVVLGLGFALGGYLTARRWGPHLVAAGSFLLAAGSALRLAQTLRGARRPSR
jgi:hypothetical protein